jgi:hypothetical protein
MNVDADNTCKHNGTELFFKRMSHFEMDDEGKDHVICNFCGKKVITYLPVSDADVKTFVAQRRTQCVSYAHNSN